MQDHNTNRKSLKAEIIKNETRPIKINEEDGKKVYVNGVDNLYPNYVEGLILNSPTGLRASNIMAKFISGYGLVNEELGKKIINKKNNLTYNKLLRIISRDIATQGGCFLHIFYGINEEWVSDNTKKKYIPIKYEVLHYSKCRIQKEDDDKNLGKIVFKDYANNSKSFGNSSDDDKTYFPFNNNDSVIEQQMISESGKDYKDENGNINYQKLIKNSKGQVLYINSTPEFQYSLSPAHAVLDEMETERNIIVYDKKQTSNGFLGRTFMYVKEDNEESFKEIKTTIKGTLGAENSDGIVIFQVSGIEDADKLMKIENVKSNYDDGKFEKTEKRVYKNILGAFAGMPKQLFDAGETALFGTSAEAYKEYKNYYNEQTEDYRDLIEQSFQMIGIQDFKIKEFV